MPSFVQKAVAASDGIARNVRRVVAEHLGAEEGSSRRTDVGNPFASTTPATRRSSRHHGSDPARHRLFLLATAFVTRGLGAQEAYTTAFYYVHGPGRGQTWIRALSEEDKSVDRHNGR
jgi:hypothetical protein